MRFMILLIFAHLFLAGCDSLVEIKNSVPRLTWLQVAPAEGDAVEITLWVFDLEGDPVDLSGGWAVEGEVDVTPLVWGAGGHGPHGLTTLEGRFEPDGQPHSVIWNVAGLPLDQPIQLILTPEDALESQGETVASPSFRLADGMPEPAQWTAP